MATLGAANTNSQGAIVNSTTVAVANEGADADKRGPWELLDWAGLPVANAQVAVRPPNTIDRNRSRRRPVVTGVNAALQLETSLGFGNLYRLAPSLMFSKWRGVEMVEHGSLSETRVKRVVLYQQAAQANLTLLPTGLTVDADGTLTVDMAGNVQGMLEGWSETSPADDGDPATEIYHTLSFYDTAGGDGQACNLW